MMGQIKRDISIIISICALTLSMIMGLAIDARPEIILIRAFLSLFVSAIFIFLLGSIIEKFSKNPQNSLIIFLWN
jgi:hypothetical protein